MFAVESLLFQHQGLKVAKKAGWHNSSFVGLLQNYVYCSGTFGPTRIFQILGFLMQTWNLSKNLHRRILRLKILHRQFHLISTVLVGKNTKNEWKWRNLLRWQKFYTAAGTDGMDKFHLCPSAEFRSYGVTETCLPKGKTIRVSPGALLAILTYCQSSSSTFSNHTGS